MSRKRKSKRRRRREAGAANDGATERRNDGTTERRDASQSANADAVAESASDSDSDSASASDSDSVSDSDSDSDSESASASDSDSDSDSVAEPEPKPDPDGDRDRRVDYDVPKTGEHDVDAMAEPPSVWQRHDLLVLIGALALLAGGVLAYRSKTAPRTIAFAKLGLTLERPSAWLPPQQVPPPPSSLALAVGPNPAAKTPAKGELPHHVMYQSASNALGRLEIRIDKRPSYNNLRGALNLARVGRYGEVYWAADSSDETIKGRDWVRTRFRYAYKPDDANSPRVATGIEYATLNGGLVYVVTLHGSDKDADALRALIAPTLTVDPNHPAAVQNK